MGVQRLYEQPRVQGIQGSKVYSPRYVQRCYCMQVAELAQVEAGQARVIEWRISQILYHPGKSVVSQERMEGVG